MRRRLLLLGPLAVLTGLLEAAGGIALVLLIKVAAHPSTFSSLPVTARMFRLLPADWQKPELAVGSFAAIFAVFYIIKNTLLLQIARTQNSIARDTLAKLTQSIVHQYLVAPYRFFLLRNSADLISNATSASEAAVRNVMLTAVNILSEVMAVLGLGTIFAVLGPKNAIIFLSILGLVLLVTLSASRKTFVMWGREEHKTRMLLLKSLQEIMHGMKEVKLLGREGFFERLVVARQNELADIESRISVFGTGLRLLLETVLVLGTLAVIALLTIGREQSTTLLPLLGLYVYAGFRVIPSINRITIQLNTIRRGAAAVDALHEDLFAQHEFIRVACPIQKPATFSQSIVLDSLGFSYDGSRRVLSDIDLVINKGECIAVVGETGAGKTTLVSVIAGLLEPTTGRVLVDGVELPSIVESWQRKIAYVPQSVFLIDDTIRHNIAFALDDCDIDESRVLEAIRLSSLSDVVARLPRGLETPVGDQGVQLSGGERQRIAIARAFYHDAGFIILDEPSSALDYWTELSLVQNLRTLREQRTLLIVSHRASLVQSCDRVLLLRRGRAAVYKSYAEFVANGAGLEAKSPELAVEPQMEESRKFLGPTYS